MCDWYHLYNFKKREKYAWRSITFSKVAAFLSVYLLKVTLLCECFSCFLNHKNGTKFRKASQIFQFQDSILIENMHDLPYLNRTVGPEITAAMTLASNVMKSMATNIPCGIQILAGCNKEAMAVAKVRIYGQIPIPSQQ